MATPYRERILDHYLHPRNRGPLEHADFVAELDNPTCGDTIRFAVRLSDEKVLEARFEGHGCVLSLAAASMLTEEIIGKNIAELKALGQAEIFRMLGIELGPVRAKCGLLALQALQRGLAEWESRQGVTRRLQGN